MKKFLKILTVTTVFTLILSGCDLFADTMDKMEDQLNDFKKEMENGFVYKVEYLDGSNLTTTMEVVSRDEFNVVFSDGTSTFTLICGIDGVYSASDSTSGETTGEDDVNDVIAVCSDAYSEYELAFDFAFEDEYFDEMYDVDYSEESDYFLASGTYEDESDDYEYKIYKDLSKMTFDASSVSITVTVGNTVN